ncbi:shikimate dehydrogenase [Campylobacter hyointestinalis subsp. lawsonii CCUG 27631]|uniref:shikimate dehydrogenase n=1 Tax=Campylobacter hyointestinalis TaxID=198 RepID=UPI0007C899A3|nr:shikimate dehydrogenase [Campylobacter hyointestinalis]ANE34017.1 shikimate dehydrogenase [Campylobacter hyointestinalis subsp. lawsonii CCUG 27631]
MRYFAVFGDPINHSISPRLHNLALQGLGLNGFYGRIHLKDGSKLIEVFNKFKLSGANITIPHKETAFRLCDEADDFANSVGSVNTLVKRNSKIYGFNTDAPGFMMAISEFKAIKSALVIGAGGTSKAISYAMKKSGIDIDILNRSDKSLMFKEYNFYTKENYRLKAYDLVVNTTPAGLLNNDFGIDEKMLSQILDNSKFAFDVIYNKNTPFLNLATKKGLLCKDGKDMLLYQAVLAFNLFYENKFDPKTIKKYMSEAFLLR